MPFQVNNLWTLLTVVSTFICILTISYFFSTQFQTLRAAHMMVWKNGPSLFSRIKVVRDVIMLTGMSIIGIIIESLTCIDYINEKSLSYDTFWEMKSVFVLMLFLSTVVIGIKWFIFIRMWAHHVAFYTKQNYLVIDQPTPLFQLTWTLQLLLHNAVYKKGSLSVHIP